MNGNKLQELLQGSGSEQILAMGYIAGVHDSGQTVTHCSPDAIKLGELTEMTKMWLRANSCHLNETADVLLHQMLQQVFPCNNQRNSYRSL